MRFSKDTKTKKKKKDRNAYAKAGDIALEDLGQVELLDLLLETTW